MRTLALFATLLVCSCSKGPRLGGLIADVKLLAGARATCAQVTVSDAAGKTLSSQLAFGAKSQLRIGIGSEGYAQEVTVSVTPRWGPSGCTGARANGAAVVQQASFPSSGTTELIFELGAPAASVDADRDGFVGADASGPDCNDGDANAHPGAVEDCLSLADLDCNQLSGCADPVCTAVSGCAMPADRLEFTTAAQTVDVDACSGALTVESRGPMGASALPPSVPVALAALPGSAGARFFSDSACTAQVTALAHAGPQSSFTFYFRAPQPGTLDVIAAAPMLTPATQQQTVRAANASQLGFSSPPRAVVAGSCTAAIDVEARDSAGAPRQVAADVTVALDVAPAAAVTFHADPACAMAALSEVTIATSLSSARFYVKGLSAGAPVMSASAAGYSTAMQPVTVSAGPAHHLAFVTPAQGIARNACSSVTGVRAEDALGNAAALAGPVTVDLAETGVAGFSFHADPACGAATMSAALAGDAGSVASFYFLGTTAGPATVSAAVSGGDGGIASAVQVENIGVGPPARLELTPPALSVTAGACSAAVTVEVRDDAGIAVNPPLPVAVTLVGAPDAGFSVYADPSCLTPLSGPLVISGAPSSSFRFKAQRSPTQRIDATAVGLAPAFQVHTVVPASAHHLGISTPPRSAVATTCSPNVHVEVLDAYGNLKPVTNLPVSLATASAGATFHSGAAGCAAPLPAMVSTGDGGFDFRFIGLVAGPMPVTVSSSGGVGATSQVEQIDAGPASVLAFTTLPRTQFAGQCSPAGMPVVVVTRDNAGNAVPVASPLTVSLSANDGGVQFFAAPACTSPVSSIAVAASTSSAQLWFSGRKAGVATVSAAATGLSPATQDETIAAADPAQVVLLPGGRTAQVGTCSAAPVGFEARDPYGNPTPLGVAVAFSLDAGPNLQFFTGPACATPVPSVTVPMGMSGGSFHFKGAVAGIETFSVGAPGFTPASDTLTVAPGATRLGFTTGAQTRYAGQCSNSVTVQTQNAGGAAITTPIDLVVTPGPASSAGFTFYSDMGCTTPVTQLTVPAGSSAVTYWFRGITGGATTLSAAASGLSPATQNVTVISAARSGQCTIGNGQFSSTNCPIDPPLLATDRTVIVFQTTPAMNSSESRDNLARCHLLSVSQVQCTRGDNRNVSVTSYWQTFTWPTDATVQHLPNVNCQGNTTNVTVNDLGPVDGGGNAFVLHAVSGTSASPDDDENDTLTLTSPTTVSLEHTVNGCGSGMVHDLQLVRLTGAVVTPGTAQLNGTTQASSGVLPAGNVGRQLLLYSWKVNSSGNDVCERSVRGSIASATQVQFNRALGVTGSCVDNGPEDLAFQRVELPATARVQAVQLDLANTMLTVTQSLPLAVDPTRTLVMTGSMTHNMSALGETNVQTEQNLDNYVARFNLDSTGTAVTATRGGATGAVRYTVFVVELEPH
ncbi:MAG: hypothetical protein IPJ65_34390 [Archangiaceae bacterium]|nr:hypothetical protein [Archangiaceae bacterium]